MFYDYLFTHFALSQSALQLHLLKPFNYFNKTYARRIPQLACR